jgi:acyl carrier protein
VLPQTPNEEALCGIWRDVLTLDCIGIHDDFFDLSGDSLRAAQVVARANAEFGVNISVADFFKSPTITAMALLITQEQAARADAAEVERILADVSGRRDRQSHESEAGTELWAGARSDGRPS